MNPSRRNISLEKSVAHNVPHDYLPGMSLVSNRVTVAVRRLMSCGFRRKALTPTRNASRSTSLADNIMIGVPRRCGSWRARRASSKSSRPGN